MKKSTSTHVWLGARLAVILLVTVASLYQFVVARMTESSRIDRKIASVAKEVGMNLQILRNARRLLNFEENEQQIWEERVTESIPREPKLNEALDLLGRQAVEAGLKLLSSYAEPEKELEKERKGRHPRYFRIPIRIEVTGPWESMGAYVDRIRTLPRRARLTSLEIVRNDEFFPACHGMIHLDVFYLLKEAPPDALPRERKR